MAEKFVGKAIQDPRERLVALVAANMLKEPNFYAAEDQKRKELVTALETVVATHPEFVCQLAYYAREKMNVRSTSNFLLAFAATHSQCKPLLPRYFRASVRLPNDLLEVVQHVQSLTSKAVPDGHYYVPKSLKREVKLKFKDFNIYQLGKYCSEGRRKRLGKKQKKDPAAATAKLQLAMKRLVRLCHISEPPEVVCSIIGKRYPDTEEEYQATSLAATGPFDPSRAHKRMKIPTPTTWETELSAHGNKAEVWESLIRSRKLPFMAMLRNIRNLLVTGVERNVHEMVIERLTDPQQVAQSRLFPFRFFSAFEAIKIDVETLQKIKDDPTYEPPAPEGKRAMKSRSRGRSRGRGRSRSAPPPVETPPQRKVIIPKEVPSASLIEAYKSALETSVRLATTANVAPVLGHSVIFCDVSGSMSCKLSGGTGLGSVRTCRDAGVLLGLMLRYVCESSELVAFSSPGSAGKCWFPITLTSDNILENMAAVVDQSSHLGGGTDFPYDFVQDLIRDKRHVDQIFVFSDMMIAPGAQEMAGTATGGQSSISVVLEQYRAEVNPNMKFVTVDLAVSGRDILGASFDDDFRNLKVFGYSDSILALVSELQTSQVAAIESFAQEKLGPKA